MLAVLTWFASTLAFHAVNVSFFVVDDVGAKSNSAVMANPASQMKCVQRGAGFFAVGLGGSLGGPGRADVDQ